MEDAINLAKNGRILKALLFLKEYVVENENLWDKSNENCQELFKAIMSMPSLNDESWGIFVPSIDYEEFMEIVRRVYECMR